MPDAPVYSESLFAELELGWAPLHAWRTARYKFILAPRPELYDLAADAAEVTNRVQAESERAGKMGDELRALLARPVPAASAVVDTETAERLAALGYAGGGRPPGAARSGRDPKDGLALLAHINRGAVLARTDPPTAIRELSLALAEDPALVTARRTRIVAYDEAGRPDLAIADLRVLEKQGVFTSDDAVVLADNLRHVGKLDEALAVLTRTAQEDPRFAKPWLAVAEIHIGRKQHRQAAEAYEQALKIAPDHIEALRGLGDVALLEGNLPEAQSRYARILELDRTDALAMTKLGIVHMRAGRPAEATALFRQAVERVPDNPEALLYLAGALASGGRSAEAVPYFERVLVAWPRSVMALNGLGFALLDAGDRRGAADAFRKSLRIDPKQPDVSRHLADLADRSSN
jgi:tetratricopeptide (TPR) repeat protein